MTTKTRGALDRAAERLMDMDSAVYGDEREQAVVTEASTFGMTIGLYANMAAAVVAALLGQLVLPVVLLVVMAAPTLGTVWYAGRRGVDMNELAGRASRRSRLRAVAWSFGTIGLSAGAMLYTVRVGHGIVPVGEVDVMSDGVVSSMVTGALIGAIIGGVIGAIAFALGLKRRRTEAPSEDADD